MAAVINNKPEFKDENDLIRHYTRLVRAIGLKLSRTLPRSVALDDLLQAGYIGLLDAYRRYDGTKGASFDTYAGIRIRGAMLDELRSDAGASRRVVRELRRAQELTDQLEQSGGREVSAGEIAEAMGMDLDVYDRLIQDAAARYPVSLNQPANDSDATMLDQLCGDFDDPEHILCGQADDDALAEATANLPERERTALALYLNRGLNLRETGNVMGVTESRICQLHSSAVKRLRAALTETAA